MFKSKIVIVNPVLHSKRLNDCLDSLRENEFENPNVLVRVVSSKDQTIRSAFDEVCKKFGNHLSPEYYSGWSDHPTDDDFFVNQLLTTKTSHSYILGLGDYSESDINQRISPKSNLIFTENIIAGVKCYIAEQK